MLAPWLENKSPLSSRELSQLPYVLQEVKLGNLKVEDLCLPIVLTRRRNLQPKACIQSTCMTLKLTSKSKTTSRPNTFWTPGCRLAHTLSARMERQLHRRSPLKRLDGSTPIPTRILSALQKLIPGQGPSSKNATTTISVCPRSHSAPTILTLRDRNFPNLVWWCLTRTPVRSWLETEQRTNLHTSNPWTECTRALLTCKKLLLTLELSLVVPSGPTDTKTSNEHATD